jgi:hypothetical protein
VHAARASEALVHAARASEALVHAARASEAPVHAARASEAPVHAAMVQMSFDAVVNVSAAMFSTLQRTFAAAIRTIITNATTPQIDVCINVTVSWHVRRPCAHAVSSCAWAIAACVSCHRQCMRNHSCLIVHV